MLLQRFEEVSNLQSSVFWQIRAVNSVSNSIVAKFTSKIMLNLSINLPDSVGTQMFRDLWVVGATQLSKGGDNVLLAHFKRDHRAIRQMLNQGKVLGKDTLVNREEFFDHGSGQVKHLHG